MTDESKSRGIDRRLCEAIDMVVASEELSEAEQAALLRRAMQMILEDEGPAKGWGLAPQLLASGG